MFFVINDLFCVSICIIIVPNPDVYFGQRLKLKGSRKLQACQSVINLEKAHFIQQFILFSSTDASSQLSNSDREIFQCM